MLGFAPMSIRPVVGMPLFGARRDPVVVPTRGPVSAPSAGKTVVVPAADRMVKA